LCFVQAQLQQRQEGGEQLASSPRIHSSRVSRRKTMLRFGEKVAPPDLADGPTEFGGDVVEQVALQHRQDAPTRFVQSPQRLPHQIGSG